MRIVIADREETVIEEIVKDLERSKVDLSDWTSEHREEKRWHMVTTKNKVKLKKPFGVFTDVGKVYDVESINGGVITIKFGDGYTFGCMPYKEFEEYFEVSCGGLPQGEWILGYLLLPRGRVQ